MQQAAVAALEHRQGTIILMDPWSGRIQTVVNPDLAFEKAFAPGSTIKPFTALVASRSELIAAKAGCRGTYANLNFQTTCSHPPNLLPLNTAEAIAHSCNYYFAKLGEQVREADFRSLLSQFGFGEKSGVHSRESTGNLGGTWRSQNALAEGDYLQVTPIQLLVAYSALVNGGQLLSPQVSSEHHFKKQVRRSIELTKVEHTMLLEGLQGSVKFGTASRAGLSSLPVVVMGKTGTSTPLKGFRNQGWFVGFAGSTAGADFKAQIGVLVFLKRGHGSDAAAVSRTIFETFVRLKSQNHEATAQLDTSLPAKSTPPNSSELSSAQILPGSRRQPFRPVSVLTKRTSTKTTLSLEEYLLGVVAREGSTETQLAALKALAVVSRSYALGNLGRHARDGYDFCDTTHCQLFVHSNQVRPEILRAVAETAEQVLIERSGNLAETYFSASCGGESANITNLWNSRPKPYLLGVSDEYCATMPHSRWTDVISTEDLHRALRSDSRTDVGDELRDVFVSRRDRTGRAEQLRIRGKTSRVVSGWDFKLIVGRALGWNLLKSSRFHLTRSGSRFIFSGSGFGHGLGLCQEGAHKMAERGLEYRQILAKYFPGTMVDLYKAGHKQSKYSADLLWTVEPIRQSSKTRHLVRPSVPGRLRISDEHFRLSYPATLSRGDAKYLLQVMGEARRTLLNRPSLPYAIQLPVIEVYVNETTGDFVGRTGLPWWAAAGSRGQVIELQPIEVLRRRGILETTLRHELVHKIIDKVGKGQTPRWLAEGLAIYLAGEGPLVSRHEPDKKLSIAELEEGLSRSSDAPSMREIYAAAYKEVRGLIITEGEEKVWQRVSAGEN